MCHGVDRIVLGCVVAFALLVIERFAALVEIAEQLGEGDGLSVGLDECESEPVGVALGLGLDGGER